MRLSFAKSRVCVFPCPLPLSSRPERQENLDVSRALWRGVEGSRRCVLRPLLHQGVLTRLAVVTGRRSTEMSYQQGSHSLLHCPPCRGEQRVTMRGQNSP